MATSISDLPVFNIDWNILNDSGLLLSHPYGKTIQVNTNYFDELMEENKTIMQKMIDEGVVDLTIRRGDAMPVANPDNILIEGAIDAPSRFVAKREVDPKTSYCYYSVSEGQIRMVVNENRAYGRHEILGSLKLSPKFINLGINSEATYTPKQLARKFKLLRSLFTDNDDHMKICKTLNNLELKVEQTIQDLDDRKGNVTLLRRQALESNIPDIFTMILPIILGEPKQTIEVQVSVFYANATIQCQLESVEAADYIEETFEKRVLEEIKLLEDHTTLIAR